VGRLALRGADGLTWLGSGGGARCSASGDWLIY